MPQIARALLLGLFGLLSAACATRSPSIIPAAVSETASTSQSTEDATGDTLLGVFMVGMALREFTLTLDQKTGPNGYAGTFLYTLDRATTYPATDIEYDGSSIRFSVIAPGQPEAYRAHFSATFDDQAEGKGSLKQANQSISVDWWRDRRRPQTPTPPFPYTVEEVQVPGAADASLSGTLTLPKGDAPHPPENLNTGSGMQNRDSELALHRPFWVIADHLTRHGIAVLRLDDRGAGQSTGDPNANWDILTEDALSAVAFLAEREDIDGKRVGLMGHSQGASIAPMAAAQRPDAVAFVVLLAGMGMSGSETLVRQAGATFAAMGVPEDLASAVETAYQAFMVQLLDPKASDDARLKTGIEFIRAQAVAVKTIGQTIPSNQFEAMAKQTIAALLPADDSTELITYNPSIVLPKVQAPVLALNGSLDTQVLANHNLPEIERLVQSGGNTQVTIHLLEGLNHGLMPAKQGTLPEMWSLETTFSPDALRVISEWIRGVSGLNSP